MGPGYLMKALFYNTNGLVMKAFTPSSCSQPGYLNLRIQASSVHPADLLSIHNRYPHSSAIAGNDAVAIDTATGRQVIIIRSDFGGMWCKEQSVREDDVYIVEPELPIEQAAQLRVNPGTAYQLLQRYGHCNLLISAANSQVGRHLFQLHSGLGFKSNLIGLVRKDNRLEEMRKSFPNHRFYLDHDRDCWQSAVKEWKTAAVGLDCVGGSIAADMLHSLPSGSTLCSYGALSGEPLKIGVKPLIFESKRVEGFWMSQWCREQESSVIRKMMDELCELVRNGKLELAALDRIAFEDITDGSELTSKSLIVM